MDPKTTETRPAAPLLQMIAAAFIAALVYKAVEALWARITAPAKSDNPATGFNNVPRIMGGAS